jgi:tetratricopeptide (TPR) repeat protein
LINDVKGAEEDLLESIKLIPSFAQSWVKIASVYMEQGNPERTFEAFEEAIKHNPNDPDIYYHRGQGQRNSISPISSTYLTTSALHHERLQASGREL